MSYCKYQLLLSAYNDYELDAITRQQVADHADNCLQCANALQNLQKLSARFAFATATLDSTIDLAAMVGMHRAVERSIQSDSSRRSLFRTVGLLTAVAASVLIISGVWLLDSRSRSQMESQSAAKPRDEATSTASDWERVAITLRAQPRPAIIGDSPFTPHYAESIHWMLDGLVPTNSRIEAKPWIETKSF